MSAIVSEKTRSSSTRLFVVSVTYPLCRSASVLVPNSSGEPFSPGGGGEELMPAMMTYGDGTPSGRTSIVGSGSGSGGAGAWRPKTASGPAWRMTDAVTGGGALRTSLPRGGPRGFGEGEGVSVEEAGVEGRAREVAGTGDVAKEGEEDESAATTDASVLFKSAAYAFRGHSEDTSGRRMRRNESRG